MTQIFFLDKVASRPVVTLKWSKFTFNTKSNMLIERPVARRFWCSIIILSIPHKIPKIGESSPAVEVAAEKRLSKYSNLWRENGPGMKRKQFLVFGFSFFFKMFSDSNAENRQTVHIKSDWKRVKKTSHNGCQTSQRKLLDQESQVAFYQDAEIQTIK